MGVDVHGNGDAGVAQDLLHDLDGDPLGQEQGGADVAEVVEAYVRETGTPEEGFEAPGHEV